MRRREMNRDYDYYGAYDNDYYDSYGYNKGYEDNYEDDYDYAYTRPRGYNDGNENGSMSSNGLDRPDVARELKELLGQSILITLAPDQLNVLNQVFRPIMCGRLVEVTNQYITLERVNIKMSNAPEFIFPTPLIIPLVQLIWYMPFDCNTRFPLF